MRGMRGAKRMSTPTTPKISLPKQNCCGGITGKACLLDALGTCFFCGQNSEDLASWQMKPKTLNQ